MVATPIPIDPNYGTPMNPIPSATPVPVDPNFATDMNAIPALQVPTDFNVGPDPSTVTPVVPAPVTVTPVAPVTPAVNTPGGPSDIELMGQKPPKPDAMQSKEFLQTLSNNFKDKLKQQVAAGVPIDNAVRDEMFNQAIKDLGGNFDVNNPNAERIRKGVYDNALFGLQLGNQQGKTWEEYYTKTGNQIERTHMIMQIPSDEIAKRLASGDLKYKDVQVLAATNPERLNEIFRLKKQYTDMQAANAAVAGTTTQGTEGTSSTVPATMDETIATMGIPTPTAQNTATSSVPDASGTLLEQYDSMMNNPEIKAARDALNPITEQIKLLELEKGKLARTIEGKVTDKALFNAIYRDEVAGIDDSLSALYIKQGTLKGTYDTLEQDAKDRFGIHLKELDMEAAKAEAAAGKFTAIADGFGGITILNTKTGATKSAGLGGEGVPSSGGGITNSQWAGMTDEQKNQVIAQMNHFEGGGDGSRSERHNNPTAFTTDVAKQAGLVEGVDYERGDAFPNNPNMFTARLLGDANGITRRVIDKIGFFTAKGNPRWSYVNQLGPDTSSTSTNLGYQDQFSSYYQLANDGKGTIKDAVLAGYKGTPQQFAQESNAYRTRIDTALNSVGVDKDAFNLGIYASIAKVPVALQPKTMDAIYNLVAKNPSLAKPENSGKLREAATSTQQASRSLIEGVKLLESKWKALTDAGQNNYSNWLLYEGAEGTISNIFPRLGAEPTGVINDFLSQRKTVGQIIAQLIEKGRLSDSDRTFYQGILPKLNTPNYQAGIDKLNNIKTTFLNQGAPGSSGEVDPSNQDGM